MKNAPAISIIVPMFNVERYIETCINSILMQTFENFELIIIDDCSTDRSYEFAKSFKDPRIRLFRNLKNIGADSSRNVGLSFASDSEFVYMIDADDAIMPQTLETLISAAKESQADVVYMNSYFRAKDPDFSLNSEIDGFRRLMHNPKPRFLSSDLIERLYLEYIASGEDIVTVWIKFIRHDFLRNSGIYIPNLPRGGDFFMDFATMCLAKRICVIDACFYIHRTNPDSLINMSSKKHVKNSMQIVSTAIAYLDDIFSKELISPLSRENQITLESHLIFRFLHFHFAKPSNDISIEELDELLHEITQKHSSNAPEVSRILLHIMRMVINYSTQSDKKELFELKR